MKVNDFIKDHKLHIEMIAIAIILTIVVFIILSNRGSDAEFAAMAANARKPIGEVFGELMSKYF